MFEKLVESVLEEYVSEWIDGLDSEKMKVALFGGKVEFRDLRLKTSSLDQFQLPLAVKAGTVGRLSLKVPWKRLTKEAVSIHIEDLTLLVVPAHEEEMHHQPPASNGAGTDKKKSNTSEQDTEDSYALRIRWAKQQEVRVRELLEKNKREDTSTDSASSATEGSGDTTASWGYREKILHNILDNVSFEFSRIHIRYEDTTQLITKNPLALGVTIDAITVNTTNANGHVTFIDRSQSHTPFVHKTLEMKLAGLYCDDTSSIPDLVSVRRSEPLTASYILHPFNTSIKMTVNHDETTAFSIPKLQFVADIGSINASVTPDQCNDLVSVINFVSTHEVYLKRIHCRRKRPTVPVKRHATTWWKYALLGVQVMYSLPSRKLSGLSHGSGASSLTRFSSPKPPCDWKLFGVLWRYQHEYISLHKKLLRAAAKKVPVESVVAERYRLNELEDILDVDSIVFFRICATQELEVEETRHDSSKKLSNWKARWSARTHKDESSDSAAPRLRALDPTEKMALYTAINEHMSASSQALAHKKLDVKAQTILFAIDIAIASVRVSLVEHMVIDVASPATSSTREFLQFELQQLVFAIFQRNGASSITSSIQSIHMLDFSQTGSAATGGERRPQALFYSLASTATQAESAHLGATKKPDLENASKAVPTALTGKRFVDLKIETSNAKFALDCSFEPFRYIHNLSVAAKLQTYFVVQVDVAPALKENAEDALAYSSEWLNKAVFAGSDAARKGSSRVVKRSQSEAALVAKRTVEFSIRLPEVDVLVLMSDTSPILQARLLALEFKSGNLLDTFEFAIESVSLLFYDDASVHESAASTDALAREPTVHGAKPLQHQGGLKDVRQAPSQERVAYDLTRRRHSTILKKTRLVFHGEQISEPSRSPRWSVQCTAPPIYFTLSSAQYRQVLQTSASWANSNAAATQPPAGSAPPSSPRSSISDEKHRDRLRRSTSSFAFASFDDDDERLGISIIVSQILVVLEGATAASAESSSGGGSSLPPVDPTSELAIDLVLDIKQVNVEARFSSSAQAVTVDLLSLALFKRRKAALKAGTNEKMSTAEALAQANERLSPANTTSAVDDDADVAPSEPDPVYDPNTGEPTCKLLELGPKVRFTLRSADPFTGKIWTQQVVLYWDQDLLVALFRSYFLDSSNTCAASHEATATTAASRPLGADAGGASVVGDSAAMTASVDSPGLFGIELHVERWFIFCRPCNTQSTNFALKLYGKGLFGDISTLRTPYLVVKVHVKGGVTLESSRVVTESFGIASQDSDDSTPAPIGTGEDVCELLSVNEPITVTVESAGYGVLAHRTSAATYVHILGSSVAVNYVNAHFGVFGDYLQNQLVSFFNWISVQTQPPDVVLLDERTKIDADLTNVRLYVPRGAVGNPVMRQKKPERMEVDIQKVCISSRPYPDSPRMEQLRIQVDEVRISTCMIEAEARPHTDAVGSVDEAVTLAEAKASRRTLDQLLAASKTIMFYHAAVFVEFVALPIVESQKQKKRRKQREAERAATMTRKNSGIKDMADVAEEMEKLCAFVKVSLHRPSDWALDTNASSSETTASAGRRLNIKTRHEIDLALDLQQLELCGCILNENLGESEVLPRARPFEDAEDEFQALEVQVVIGDVNLSILSSNTIADYKRQSALSPEERTIVQVSLRTVKVLISDFSSNRAQYRVLTSKASLWLVDDPITPSNGSSDDDGSATKTTGTRVLTSCAEMYPGLNADDSEQCIDVTIDEHAKPLDPNAPRRPQDIRVHVENCALAPSIVQLASRIEPFLFGKSRMQFYAPSPAAPVNVSVTTGVVHCMLAQYSPDMADNPSGSDKPTVPQTRTETDTIMLHLILSGCFVVRYSNADPGLQHVQVFGRKMSVEVAALWPPQQDAVSAIAAIPPLSPSPTRPPLSPKQHRGLLPTHTRSSLEVDALANYRRVLCDDFAIDMDLIDTMNSESLMKISASLTHFHCVLCTFDLFMISQIATFDFADARPRKRDDESDIVNQPDEAEGAAATASIKAPTGRNEEVVVNTVLEDASVTFVREIGEYFTPVARIHTCCAMCKVRVEMPPKATRTSPSEENNSQTVLASGVGSNVVEIALHFSEDSGSELREDEGLSVWGFNTLLGSWEPLVEPWTFALGVTLVDDRAGKVVTSVDLSGSDVHALSLNCSPSLLDSLCAIAKEMDQLVREPRVVHVSTASIISCGFYLANDCGVEISYWVSDNGATSHTSTGFSYAPRQKCAPEQLLPRHKVPLKLSTALFHSLPADQTVSFSWGDDAWHPLTDVRIHSAGKYVYSVLPRTSALAVSTTSTKPATVPPMLLALFDISSVFGYRTLTVSSLVRVFNETDISIDCSILAADGKSVIEIGTIEPHDACGVPITLVQTIAAIRVLVKPHRSTATATPALTTQGRRDSRCLSPPTASSGSGADTRDHRWSNELFISEKEDCTEHYAACSLVLDDYDCKCQRMFDGSQPLHVSQICRANGSFFRVWNRTFAASNASSLRYAQMRVLPPLTFENKCGVALFVVVFVFKKVRRTGAQDREYFHLVASEKIAPHCSMQFLASSLHENTYCSVSMTGFSWSKLFLLPSVFPSVSSNVSGPNDSSRTPAGGAGRSSPAPSSGSASNPASPSSSSHADNNEVLCTLLDFRTRQATINVVFVSSSQGLNAMRKVLIQPRFVIHNDTPLPLVFEPRAKQKSNLTTAKTFFGIRTATKKPHVTCCGSSQLEQIHAKLNALNGATTTPSSPTARSTMFRPSQAVGVGAASSGSRAATSAQEEMELLYCSESNFLDVQIEGNVAPSSGVQQFRLDAAIGGANSSLRVFDENKKLWCDLVVILEQMDSYTTKVTFVERYLVLNRTSHAFICMPAVDIVPSSDHSHEPKAAHSTATTSTPENSVLLQANATTAFSWCKRQSAPSDPCVRVKLQGVGDGNVVGWRWSGKFSLHEVSETALKLSNKYTNQVHVVRVEIRVESSVRVYVVLTSEDTVPFPLYRVINSTANEMIHFKQCFDGGSGELTEQSAATADLNRGVIQRLLPGESTCLGWDEAYFLQSLERVLVISYSSETTHSKILLDQPGEAQRVDIPVSKTRAAYQVYLHWYLNGVTKTIHLHDTELPRDKLTGKQNAPPAVSERTGSSNSVLQLAATLVSELNLTIKLPSILVSVLNSKPEEVLLFSGEKLELAYAKTVGVHDQCEVKIGSFQLDNQLDNAVFPVIFTPIPSNVFSSIGFMDSPRKPVRPLTPPTLQERKRPNADESGDDLDDVDQFLHISVFRLSYGDDVEYIKYLSAMLQPARVQIDDFLVISVGSLVTDCMQVVLRHFPPHPIPENEHRTSGPEPTGLTSLNAKAERSRAAISDHDAASTAAKVPPVERRMYIETLQLHPVRVHITFQQNNLSSATFFDDQDAILLPMVFMILKSNLVNIDSASLNLNALHIYHSFTTRAFMASTIQQHYAFQGILQIYALVGAADILGNPIGLVTNLGTGVKDFFYEPVAGMVKSPQEFVLGLSRGTASLVKNSVYGTFNAASKFTGTLSSGIAALSMDSKYINERNSRNRHEVPTHLGTGLLYGTKQLGQGILAGVSGVLTAPAMGAYTNGLSGFVEGVGKGLIGVAVKPTAGILDLAARTTAGITATATVFDRKARSTRVRLPRMMHTSDKRLRVYSSDEAMISQLLHKLPQRLLQNEHYEAHVFLPLSRAVVATSHQFLHVDFSSSGAAVAVAMGPAPPRITWKCPLTSVWGAQKTARGVSIMIGTATNVQVSPALNTLVTKSSMSTVLIPLRDTESHVADRVIKCVSDMVARQRQRATPESETYAAPPPRNSIGLVLEPVREGERMPAGFDGSGGQVVDVFVGSACFRAGVEVGDIIVGFGGKKFERGDHGSALRFQLSLMKKGDTLELLVLRSGEVRTIRVATE